MSGPDRQLGAPDLVAEAERLAALWRAGDHEQVVDEVYADGALAVLTCLRLAADRQELADALGRALLEEAVKSLSPHQTDLVPLDPGMTCSWCEKTATWYDTLNHLYYCEEHHQQKRRTS